VSAVAAVVRVWQWEYALGWVSSVRLPQRYVRLGVAAATSKYDKLMQCRPMHSTPGDKERLT
jgi:hypothetical protein